MADFIVLVVSGRTFSGINKDILKEASGYFRALFSGRFNDSCQTSYKFDGWSTTAFEILVNFVTTGKIDLKDRNADVLRAALVMTDYLAVDGFRPQLARTLITSWTDMLTEDALELAEDLGITRSLEEYSLLKVLSNVERQDEQTRINFDLLILVTKTNSFWNLTAGEEIMSVEDVPERWSKAFQRCKEVLELAMKLSPRVDKIRALAQNLHLHILDERFRSIVWDILNPPSVVTKLLKSAFDDCIYAVRQNTRKVLSFIRLPFVTGHKEVKTFGVAEFNMDSWSWEVLECEGKFTSAHRIVKGDSAIFLGETGAFIIRILKRECILTDNRQLGELMKSVEPCDYSICLNGELVFILVWNAVNSWKLYQFNLLSNELTETVEVSVRRGLLKGHRNNVYIVGYSRGEVSELCVFEYKVSTKDLSVIVRAKNVDFPLKAVMVLKRKIYVLSDDALTIVDMEKKVDQTLEIKKYVGVVRDLFYFMSVLDVAPGERGLLLLLELSTDLVDRQLMVAHLNINTAEVSCLCLIPKVLKVEHFPYNHGNDIFYPRMELRRDRDVALSESEDILKRLKYTVD